MALVSGAGAIALAQAPAFEVASVKPTAPDNAGPFKPQRMGIQPGDRVTINNVTLRIIIQSAFNATEIEGGPAWLGNERFDIVAKSERPVSPADQRAMLRTLLAERFKLETHTIVRPEPIYALIVARSDRRLGPNLKPATDDCATLRARNPPSPTSAPCGNSANALMTGKMTVRGLPIANLGRLAADAGRPVVDLTGLEGPFDWELTWTPQVFLQRGFDRARFPSVDPDGPNIFTAVQEQLGLKLEPRTGDREVLVIDRVERPTPD